MRYKDSFEISFTIDEEARKCMVPALICQPLVENAIKHGMQTSPMPLKVDISIAYRQDVLSIDVSNTGSLIESGQHTPEEADVHGTSLENIKQRLGIMFKDQYTFQLFEQDDWVHAKISIKCDERKKINFEKLI